MPTWVGPLVVLGIGVILSIALHEVGHLVPAKRFGVRCTQYMVGFGPTVWSFVRGGTEYGVKAIPLGGYVRMLGMFPPEQALRRAVRHPRNGKTTLAAQAREDAQREIGPEDADRLFYQRSVPKRLVVMLGGPTMNLVICVVLTTIFICGTGLQTTSTTVGAVSECVAADATATCTAETDGASPAAAAGLQVGDELVSWNGTEITSWLQMTLLIRESPDTTAQLVVRRDGELVTLSITPAAVTRDEIDSTGATVTDAQGQTVQGTVGAVGLSPQARYTGGSISLVPQVLWQQFVGTAQVVVAIPVKVYEVVHSLVTGGERDPNGPVSLIGVGRIATQMGSETSAVGSGGLRGWWSSQLSLLASLNMALFVFNLVPLLPLDGGHVAGALWEGFRRQVARLRGRPDPGPVDIARALPLAYGVSTFLIAMTVVLMYADVVNPISLTG